MKLIKKDKKGFTLVELIVVIAILAILALILIPAITGYVDRANKSKDEANARSVYSQASFELYTWDEVAEGGKASALLEGKINKTLEGVGTVTVELSNDGTTLESITFIPVGKESGIKWPKDKLETPTPPTGG